LADLLVAAVYARWPSWPPWRIFWVSVLFRWPCSWPSCY